MIWAAAFAIGLLAGLSRSIAVIATGAAIIAPLCAAEIVASGADLLRIPLVLLGAIAIFNVGLVAGAATTLLATRRR